jgi:hypothetical protein
MSYHRAKVYRKKHNKKSDSSDSYGSDSDSCESPPRNQSSSSCSSYSRRCSSTIKIKNNYRKDIDDLKVKVAQLESLIEKIIKLNKEEKDKLDIELESLRYYFSNEWKEHVKKQSKFRLGDKYNEI